MFERLDKAAEEPVGLVDEFDKDFVSEVFSLKFL